MSAPDRINVAVRSPYSLLAGKRPERRRFIFARRNFKPVERHPKPYLMLRVRLIDEASMKYFVGQVTSAIVCPNQRTWASIWLSKTKSFEFASRGSCWRSFLEKARYPV